MKASDLNEINARDIAWSEADGAVSIDAEMVAKRLNDLLACLQDLERRFDRHAANGWGHMVED